MSGFSELSMKQWLWLSYFQMKAITSDMYNNIEVINNRNLLH